MHLAKKSTQESNKANAKKHTNTHRELNSAVAQRTGNYNQIVCVLLLFNYKAI